MKDQPKSKGPGKPAKQTLISATFKWNGGAIPPKVKQTLVAAVEKFFASGKKTFTVKIPKS